MFNTLGLLKLYTNLTISSHAAGNTPTQRTLWNTTLVNRWMVHQVRVSSFQIFHVMFLDKLLHFSFGGKVVGN